MSINVSRRGFLIGAGAGTAATAISGLGFGNHLQPTQFQQAART
jgi:hypothetical protein